MTEWNPEKILKLLQECGNTALAYYDDPGIDVKDDQSLVTRADHAVEKLLAREFDRPEEGSYMIGEETIDTKSPEYMDTAFKKTAWVVDPIDGTAPYAHHLSHWGISIGFMQQGRLTESAIFLPVTREYFLTRNGEILFANPAQGEPPELKPLPTVKLRANGKSMVAVTHNILRSGQYNMSNPVQALGCAVVPFTYMLMGRFLAYIGNLKLWDIAGSIPLLRNAGFVIRYTDGRLLDDRVTPENYILDKKSDKLWKMPGQFIAAPSDEVIRHILSHIIF